MYTNLKLLVVAVGGAIAAFPITSLSTNQATIDLFQAGKANNDTLAVKMLLPSLQHLFQQDQYKIAVEAEDIQIQKSFPEVKIDTHCSHTIDADNGQALAKVKNTSYLKWGVANVSWHGATVFTDGEMDAVLDIGAFVRVKTGTDKIPFSKKCHIIAEDKTQLELDSVGKVGVGLNFTTSHTHLAIVKGVLSLVFNFHASVTGQVLKWNVPDVKVHRGCKLEILGITIFSVCGYIADKIKEEANLLTDKVMDVEAPKLLAKLQTAINTIIGDEVVIPLKLGTEQDSVVV
jgi:hypothetical protein